MAEPNLVFMNLLLSRRREGLPFLRYRCFEQKICCGHGMSSRVLKAPSHVAFMAEAHQRESSH